MKSVGGEGFGYGTFAVKSGFWKIADFLVGKAFSGHGTQS